MDRQILNITANEQILTCDNPIKISTNKVNYIEAHFDLGQNWSGYDSVRAVWFNDFNCISTVLDSLGNCAVPFEVMKRKGCVKVNLVGSISEDDVLTDRLTSYPIIAVIVDCTAQITGANTSPITPSEYEQFVAAVHEDAERAEAGATASEQSAQNASGSATSAHNSAESAHDDKIAIEEAIAEVIQQIEDFEQVQVVVNTLPPTSPATSDFTDGVLTLGIPQGVKGDTGNGIQSITKTGTSGLVDTYTITFTDGQTTTFNVTNGAKGDTGNGIQSIAKTSTVGLVDTYTITYTDGTTTTFTVTNGEKGDKGDTGEVSLSELEQATVVQTLSDNTPYNYRRTNNGNGSGTREYDEIVGASVGWNQLVLNGDFADSTGWSNYNITRSIANGVATITYTGDGTYTGYLRNTCGGVVTVIGHKYLSIFDAKLVSGAVNTRARVGASDGRTVALTSSWQTVSSVVNATGEYAEWNVTTVTTSTGGSVFEVKNCICIDLTQMFGSTIADYIYSLEQSTSGAGVSWLRTHFPKLFDNGYQPFDSGSIKSVSGLTAHEMVGANVWDEEWEVGYFNNGVFVPSANHYVCSKNLISVIPSTNYYFNIPANKGYYILYYDANGDYLRYDNARYAPATFQTSSDAHFVMFQLNDAYGRTYNHDICINLSDTSINGQYFPYEKHTYPLDSSVTLRGQYKLDANNNLYADGDVYESDGTVTRKWTERILNGSESWDSQNGVFSLYLGDGSNIYRSTSTSTEPVIISNRFSSNGIKYRDDCGDGNIIKTVGDNTQIACYSSAYADVSAFKASLASNPMRIIYKLATPTTDTATPYTNPQWCDSHGTEEYVGSELPVGHSTDYPMSAIDLIPTSNGTYQMTVTVQNGIRTANWISATWNGGSY